LFQKSIAIALAAASLMAASPASALDRPDDWTYATPSKREEPKEQRNSKGQVAGIRIVAESGWVFECKTPVKGWTTDARKFFDRLEGGWLHDKDFYKGKFGRAWAIELEVADPKVSILEDREHDETWPLEVHVVHNKSKVPGAYAFDMIDLCDRGGERTSRFAYGKVDKDRFKSSRIVFARMAWIDPFDEEGQPSTTIVPDEQLRAWMPLPGSGRER